MGSGISDQTLEAARDASPAWVVWFPFIAAIGLAVLVNQQIADIRGE